MQVETTQPSPLTGIAAAPALAVPAARAPGSVRFGMRYIALDVTMLAGAVAASTVGAATGFHWSVGAWTVAFCLLTLVLLRRRGLYALRLRVNALDDVARVATTTTVAATMLVTLRLVLDGAPAALQELRPWAFAIVYLSAGRACLHIGNANRRPSQARRVLVVGSGRVAATVARRMLADSELALLPVAYLDPVPKPGWRRPRLPLLRTDDIESAIRRHRIEHIVVAFSGESDAELLELVNRAETLGVATSIVPRLYEKVPERAVVEHLGGLPLLTPQPADPAGIGYTMKYAFDRLFALLLLVLLSPLLLATAAAVSLTLGRPVLFRQTRIGRDGISFDLLKFRTMRSATRGELAAEARAAASGLPGGVEGVDRRSPLGTFLRRSSLDELPQLVNVLRGEMSLVGPRPERPDYAERFAASVHRYGDRHRVKSGITGWAQVSGLRGKTSIEDRAEWDNWYVENFSFWLDLKILLLTVRAVWVGYRVVE
jgi:exopolysaccharide biosynthesis polyprenyl glycosylphosphotransferase